MATIDYYLSLNSPWTFLGHTRLRTMAAKAGCNVLIHWVDFGVVFPATGGLPVPKRSPQRQAYRLTELKRWRAFLDIPLNLHPAHWPADDLTASRMVQAAIDTGGEALPLAGAFMHAIWVEERNIGDDDTTLAIAAEHGFDGNTLLAHCSAEAFLSRREKTSQAAIQQGVFGAPTYVYGCELFWGQDRLDFLERALHSATPGEIEHLRQK